MKQFNCTYKKKVFHTKVIDLNEFSINLFRTMNEYILYSLKSTNSFSKILSIPFDMLPDDKTKDASNPYIHYV